MSKLVYGPLSRPWAPPRRTPRDVAAAPGENSTSTATVALGSLVRFVGILVSLPFGLLAIICSWILFAAGQMAFPLLPFLGLAMLFPVMALVGLWISAPLPVFTAMILMFAALLILRCYADKKQGGPLDVSREIFPRAR